MKEIRSRTRFGLALLLVVCAAVVGGCGLSGQGSAGVEFQGTLGSNDAGCLTLDEGLPNPTLLVLPDSTLATAGSDGRVRLPDGRDVALGERVTLDGVSARLSEIDDGAMLAARCGVGINDEVAIATDD